MRSTFARIGSVAAIKDRAASALRARCRKRTRARAELASAVKLAKGQTLLEASGGITLENVFAVAETGVDVISIGALTHSATAVDLSLTLRPARRR